MVWGELTAAQRHPVPTERDARKRWLRQLSVIAWLLVAVVAAPVQTSAQEGCQLSLQNAAELFGQGNFRAAREAIDQCLAGVPRRAEKVQAYALLAKIGLATDDLQTAETAVGRALDTDPEYEPDIFDSPRFVSLVQRVRSSRSTPVVTSVSKSKESLLEAPATVVVITAEEIERRGYLDLAAVLNDLSGFDFSHKAGANYVNIYQRGYRSIETNRTLLLIDGVEDNDLASFVPSISRQFSLSMIDRIEVIYGPASTMYGANAFAGVINVITKEPAQVVGEGHRLGHDARLTSGSWSTNALDATVAGQSRNDSIGWSLMARKYESDDFEHLADYDEWDYDSSFYSTYNYSSRLNVTNPASALYLLNRYPDVIPLYYDVVYDEDGNPIALNLNQAGQTRASGFDQLAYDQIVGGNTVGFSNPVDDWMVYGKLRISNFVFGAQFWRQMEASHVPLLDTRAATGDNGFTWTPEHFFVYAKYSRRFLEDKLSFSLFTNYKRHELDNSDSREVMLRSYHLGNISPYLEEGEVSAAPAAEALLQGREPYYNTTFSYRSNDQLRTELNLYYEQSEKFNLVGGLEMRFSSIGAKNIESATAPADETGQPSVNIAGGNQISSRDLGAYFQGSYRPWQPLKLVAGARVDNNTIRDSGGYGTVFNPRLATVYTLGDFVFKAIYSEAFQDAPNFQKYETTDSRRLDNPTLAPEEVSNFELSAGWNPSEDLTLQLVGYQADYEGIVEEVSGVPCPPELGCETTSQFQNAGRLELRGIQAEAKWTPGKYDFLVNYTYSDPYDPDDDLRVGDIADHRTNLLAETTFFKERLDASLRVNGVWGRQTGPGTTVTMSQYTEIEDYVIAHGALTYRGILKGLDLQLAVNNIFDTEYFDPAFRNYPASVVGQQIPQPPRTYFLRLRVVR